MPKTQPQKEITETEFFKRLAEKLEELFPKGKCQERGQALALNAYANIIFRDITQPQKIEDWEKEFDERFIELHPKMDCTKPTPVWDCSSLKSFIRHLLSQEESNWMAEIHEQIKSEKLELLERIIKEIKEKTKHNPEHFWVKKRLRINDTDSLAKIQSRIRRRSWEMGFNEAIKVVKNLPTDLEALKEEIKKE